MDPNWDDAFWPGSKLVNRVHASIWKMAIIDKSQIKGWNSINMSYLSSFQSPYTQFKLDVLSIPIQDLYIHLCVMQNTL